ncbi:malto-oligosyltrehalose trehalohydrolase (plasmid) [Rhizobium sp. CB3060]|uniref:malto-oligosyltrehalose trehalohydrolase n=1 Tax=unclassified Rhizobium TaxID=2613769 RepID=UPI0021A8336A|nr:MULTISPECIES: malto-oligosyltrehalose trehalohydrolase [Rhizobium]MDK4741054.1 malto-oligosyltrehalose trehalohydrolase [Rhizobium sp. CNPSo 3464]UWU24940.1 malto-oligosyltrehalose trehalohydrolase [Rhizobium tropici]
MQNSFTFGPDIKAHSVTFRLWAPLQDRVKVRIEQDGEWEMRRQQDGWHIADVSQARPGDLYKFVLSDGLEVPDPASRFQPNDVHGPSELIDQTFEWRMERWKGRPWEEIVIYELHVGAFTETGTFLSAIEKLDHLQRLGITAIQLMPLSDFSGRYGWGYDGVLPYAPDSSYGRPEDLKMLVHAAHERGICVFLDVVYNHFGPDGNYLSTYAPIFSNRHKSPWGNGLNYDGEGSRFVRDFVIQNAIYWLSVFRMDGLRLDAVHAIKDDSDPHVLNELADSVRQALPDRHIHLILENEDNNSGLLARDPHGKPSHFTAQWNDDIHHALHVAATGETFGYYRDYVDYRSHIGRALAEGFVFQGEHMGYRGRSRGSPSAGLPPTAFISFMQNHDQIGNRAMGDRMVTSHSIEAIKAIAAVYLLSPQIPMLFMGEEWGAITPFPFFCDFDEELNSKVRLGRKEELSRLPGFDAEDAPDPTSEATFRSAKLRWDEAEQDKALNAYYERLITLRREKIVPLLPHAQGHSAVHDKSGSLVRVTWRLGQAKLGLIANLSDQAVAATIPADAQTLFTSGNIASAQIGPWTVAWGLSS